MEGDVRVEELEVLVRLVVFLSIVVFNLSFGK